MSATRAWASTYAAALVGENAEMAGGGTRVAHRQVAENALAGAHLLRASTARRRRCRAGGCRHRSGRAAARVSPKRFQARSPRDAPPRKKAGTPQGVASLSPGRRSPGIGSAEVDCARASVLADEVESRPGDRADRRSRPGRSSVPRRNSRTNRLALADPRRAASRAAASVRTARGRSPGRRAGRWPGRSRGRTCRPGRRAAAGLPSAGPAPGPSPPDATGTTSLAAPFHCSPLLCGRR